MKKTIRLPIFLCITFLVSAFICTGQSMSGGTEFSAFLCNSGSAMSCGANYDGELGNGTIGSERDSVIQVALLSQLKMVAAGNAHVLFLKYDGTVWGCGYNGYGQLGGATSGTAISVPAQIPGLSNIVAIAAGWEHSLFLKSDGTVWACGENYSGELGDSTNITSHIPIKVKAVSGIVAIAAGDFHSLFVKNDGTVWGCGRNQASELAIPGYSNQLYPQKIPGLTGIIKASGGIGHSIFLKNDGTVWACGENTYGQAGNNVNTFTQDSVSLIHGLPYISDMDAGGNHTLFLTGTGEVWACGINNKGQLGNGNSGSSSVQLPVMISGLTNVKEVSAGNEHSLFLKHDGTVWGCGSNDNGKLGLGSPQSFPQFTVPTKITGLCQASLSVNELSNEANISVSPNPVLTNATFARHDLDMQEPMLISICDIMGREIMVVPFRDQTVTITREKLPDGIYFYKISSETRLISIGKFITQ